MLMVVLAVIQDAGRILLVQESKPEIAGTWNLPGGKVEPGEPLVDAVLREVQEEAGIAIQLNGLLFVDQVMGGGVTGTESRMRFVFQAAPASDALKAQPDEHSMCAAWFTPAEVPALPLRNVNVVQMIDLAVRPSLLLPMSSVRARQGDGPRPPRP
jgi:ADP-ribose pyrophosphatase YjhB (NUDIX family)